mmetsp:Transcript_5385/g.17832  ORF Transcript_5385/g.17832 Transcript_5385/m.17832 type:complete len:248 (+) Transcript_5385:120-863(+)
MALVFQVPNSLAPPIIGPRGSAVRRLVQESGATSIHLSNQDAASPDRRCSIRGESAAAMCHAFDGCAALLRAECARIGRSDATRRVRFVVPEATSLLGEAALARLRGAGVATELSPRAAGEGPAARELTLCGDAPSLSAAAALLVEAILSRHGQRLGSFLSRWSFVTEYNDHFETPRRAYADILPLLAAASPLPPKRDGGGSAPEAEALAAVTVFDPYFCEGGAVAELEALGVRREKLLHRNLLGTF